MEISWRQYHSDVNLDCWRLELVNDPRIEILGSVYYEKYKRDPKPYAIYFAHGEPKTSRFKTQKAAIEAVEKATLDYFWYCVAAMEDHLGAKGEGIAGQILRKNKKI